MRAELGPFVYLACEAVWRSLVRGEGFDRVSELFYRVWKFCAYTCKVFVAVLS
jgi:hypothetical protein